jgi:hypothetical protein
MIDFYYDNTSQDLSSNFSSDQDKKPDLALAEQLDYSKESDQERLPFNV